MPSLSCHSVETYKQVQCTSLYPTSLMKRTIRLDLYLFAVHPSLQSIIYYDRVSVQEYYGVLFSQLCSSSPTCLDVT
jgi:hypothetical protein